MNHITDWIDSLVRRYLPDPFVIALFLTFFLFLMGILFTPSSPVEMAVHWGHGFWSLLDFTMQMVLILVTGYVLAISPPVARLLRGLARAIPGSNWCVIVITLVSCLAAWVNWGLGLVVGALFATEVAKVFPEVSYRRLVASAYTGFLLWHGGLSGSVPLAVNTPDNIFVRQFLSDPISTDQTLFSTFNLIALLGLAVLLPVINYFLSRKDPPGTVIKFEDEIEATDEVGDKQSWAYKLGESRSVMMAAVLLAATALVGSSRDTGFSLTLNSINFLFLFFGFLLHGTPNKLIRAIHKAASKTGPLLLQYPFYAGIMGMMTGSGLARMISEKFIEWSSPATFPVLTFWSAGLVNIFIPSGGGQWGIQGPIVLPAAVEMGANVPLSVMGVAWGDAWTNLLQPFWAIPLLAIAGLTAREIMGHCLTVLAISGIYLSLLFFVFA